MNIDLHLHSTASDGMLTPTALAETAHDAGMRLIALTDHDSVDGLAEAGEAARRTGMAFLPGVELGTNGASEIHLLGYGLDGNDVRNRQFFANMQAERKARAAHIVHILGTLGVALDFDAIARMAAHSLSRSHIARAIVEKGAASSVKEAFDRYLRPGRPAYVPRAQLDMRDVIAFLRERGAVPVLAHPGLIQQHEQQVFQHILDWQRIGLMGIEAHHPSHSPTQARSLDQFARQHGLLVTGGSDFHGEAIRSVRIGDGQQQWTHKTEDAHALWQAAAHTVGQWPGV